jgi:low temperature requirement protein LtrA
VSENGSGGLGGRWWRPMVARRPDEHDRVSTPLELFFDLCLVVAVSQAAAGLHHAVSENHVAEGVLSYLLVFFAIWWAWMNFTWFASAYDTDDALYRLTTLVQIAGGLVLAAGVPRALDTHDFTVITIGYVIMRLAMVAQWLRAASNDSPRRRAALRYAVGVSVVQVGWILRLGLSQRWFLVGFLVLAAAELLVPVYAERAAATSWHPHHIAERYGLFTLIVLGESVLSTTLAIETGLETSREVGSLLSLAAAALVTVFSMWWLYFDQSGHQRLTSLRNSMVWGYGHFFIFAAVAAVGAGIGVAVDYVTHRAAVDGTTAAMATTIPVAIYLLGVGLLRVDRRGRRPAKLALPTVAFLILAAAFSPWPIQLTAILSALLVFSTVGGSRQRSAG